MYFQFRMSIKKKQPPSSRFNALFRKPFGRNYSKNQVCMQSAPKQNTLSTTNEAGPFGKLREV